MENVMKKVGKASSFLTKYIGIIIICFSVIAFFWRDGFAWTTNYTSIFLGVAMFGMGLTIKMDDFKRVFSRPKEIVIGFVAQYTIMPVVAWGLCQLMHLPTDLALGVILVGCCPGGTASNVITYIAGGVGTLCWNDDHFHACGPTDDTVISVSACRCLGRSIFPCNGNFCCKGCTDSGPSWYFDKLDLWKADSENIRSTSTDFCCIHRNDHQWNRICQCRKNLKLWSARTWSCGTSQSLRNGHRAWSSKTFTYRI